VFNAAADTAYITITTETEGNDIALDSKTKQKLYTRRLLLIIAAKRNNMWMEIGQFPYNDINKYSLGHAALSKNGRTIYFTSDMPGGQGKTDIWYCEKLADGKWGKPVNCGAVINTKDEEAFPEIGGDGALYYASKGLPGKGSDDIYRFDRNRNQPLIAKQNPLPTKPAGPLETKVIAKAPVPPPQPGSSGIGNAESYGVNNIYYDLDKSNIRPDAAEELDKLVKLLKDHPNFKVSIASHTDSRAPGDYNYALSQRRSASVAIYLHNNGIAADRMFISSFGETRLLNECGDGVPCTEAQQQLNRRTEFRIVE
jgi:outer membrane protein OmpA-like peptidoglycan-associated protein